MTSHHPNRPASVLLAALLSLLAFVVIIHFSLTAHATEIETSDSSRETRFVPWEETVKQAWKQVKRARGDAQRFTDSLHKIISLNECQMDRDCHHFPREVRATLAILAAKAWAKTYHKTAHAMEVEMALSETHYSQEQIYDIEDAKKTVMLTFNAVRVLDNVTQCGKVTWRDIEKLTIWISILQDGSIFYPRD